MKRSFASIAVIAMVTMLAAVSVFIDEQPVAAAGTLSCSSIFAQQGTGARSIWEVDRNTGRQTSVGTFNIPGANQNINGTGAYDGDGDGYAEVIIGVLPANSGPGRSIYQYSSITGQT